MNQGFVYNTAFVTLFALELINYQIKYDEVYNLK